MSHQASSDSLITRYCADFGFLSVNSVGLKRAVCCSVSQHLRTSGRRWSSSAVAVIIIIIAIHSRIKHCSWPPTQTKLWEIAGKYNYLVLFQKLEENWNQWMRYYLSGCHQVLLLAGSLLWRYSFRLFLALFWQVVWYSRIPLKELILSGQWKLWWFWLIW